MPVEELPSAGQGPWLRSAAQHNPLAPGPVLLIGFVMLAAAVITWLRRDVSPAHAPPPLHPMQPLLLLPQRVPVM